MEERMEGIYDVKEEEVDVRNEPRKGEEKRTKGDTKKW